MTKVLFILLMVLFYEYETATLNNWRDKFSQMIENGRKMNCTKVNRPKGSKVIKFHEIPLISSKKEEPSGLNTSFKSPNSSCNLELEHVELHFNITNVFEDNSENHLGQQHYNEYEEESEVEGADNCTITDTISAYDNGSDNATDNHSKSGGNKSDDKSVNSPVYVIFT